MTLTSFSADSLVVVVGASGGIGQALVQALQQALPHGQVLGLSRRGEPAVDLTREPSIADAAAFIRQHCETSGHPLRLVINATGILQSPHPPEKSWAQLDATAMAHMFAIKIARYDGSSRRLGGADLYLSYAPSSDSIPAVRVYDTSKR